MNSGIPFNICADKSKDATEFTTVAIVAVHYTNTTYPIFIKPRNTCIKMITNYQQPNLTLKIKVSRSSTTRFTC